MSACAQMADKLPKKETVLTREEGWDPRDVSYLEFRIMRRGLEITINGKTIMIGGHVFRCEIEGMLGGKNDFEYQTTGL